MKAQIAGDRETIAALARAGADAQDMTGIMRGIGQTITTTAAPPVRTGRLASTGRNQPGKTEATVTFGPLRYAGVIHYGWAARTIRPNPFLTTSLQRNEGNAVQKLDQGIGEILTKHNLK